MACDDFKFEILEIHIQKSFLDFEKHQFKNPFYQEMIFELTEWLASVSGSETSSLNHWVCFCSGHSFHILPVWLLSVAPVYVYVCLCMDVCVCNICMCACVWCSFNHTQHVSQSNLGWSLVKESCTQAGPDVCVSVGGDRSMLCVSVCISPPPIMS